MTPGARQGPAALVDLPDAATVREAAARMSYADALHVAGTILDDIKAGTLTKPYSASVRLSLRACAEVFSREATP